MVRASALRRPLLPLLAALALLLSAGAVRAADPLPYDVVLTPSGDAALDAAAHDSATLIGLHDSAPVGPFALIGRARTDRDRLRTVLDSFGYYKGTVTLHIAGRDLDDPGLADALDTAPADPPTQVAITLERGPQFHLRHIVLPPDTPAAGRAALGLQPGAPARAADVLAARARLQAALLADGRALARVDEPQASLVPGEDALDVTFPLTAGPQVNLGAIRFAGMKQIHESYLRRRLMLQPGERFDPVALEKARQDLAAVPALASVRVFPAEELDPDGRLPVRVVVRERRRHAVSFSTAYSTDEGGTVGASWMHRNLFGNAERLTLGVAATGLGGTAIRAPGYDATAGLVLPDWHRRDQSLGFDLQAVKQSLDAYDRTAAIAGVTLSRRVLPPLTLSMGPQFEQAEFTQEGVTRSYSLMQARLMARWDSSDDPFDPTRGLRATFTLTPSYAMANGSAGNSTFFIAQGTASTYLDVGAWTGGTAKRSVLALRGLVGAVNGADLFDLPPDQRFYLGGGGTVRGFRFQSLGQLFASGHPTGGTAVDVGTVELRQRIGESWGGAVFVDAGQIATSGSPFHGPASVGAGAGVRYFTSIGPIRADIAFPVTSQRKGDVVEFYIGIGQAF